MKLLILLLFLIVCNVELLSSQSIGGLVKRILGRTDPSVAVDISQIHEQLGPTPIKFTQDYRVAPQVFEYGSFVPMHPQFLSTPLVHTTKYAAYQSGPTESIQCQCTPTSNCEQQLGYQCDDQDRVSMRRARPDDIICCPLDKIKC